MTTNAGKVCVIDDDHSARQSLHRLLSSRGLDVESFASAAEFLDHAHSGDYCCAVLDVNMPEINGVELHQRMTTEGLGIPVVFLTGAGDIPMGVNAIKLGAVDFLVKPVVEDDLFQALDTARQRYSASQGVCQKNSIINNCFARLSPRERSVLKEVLKGRLNKQIGYDLGIAEKTVKVHRARVMEKMEADSLASLIRMCFTAGLDLQ